MTAKQPKKKLLEHGDVLQTNPKEGFWGCALVLTEQEAIGKHHPMCHIGTTPILFRHKYAYEELDLDTLTILEEASSVRTGPYEYKPLGSSLDIGIYSRKMNKHTCVIGNIDTGFLELPPFDNFKVGNGRDGGFALRGPVTSYLGLSAVHAWREIYDQEQLKQESAAAQQSHEDMLIRLKDKNRTS